ncbi:MAG: T9SS type A sorting domain-containing protein [Chlorobi bacterium]|nr:T9SS type A sorting domain-containing protein [Chlorobiota bacterium]
MDLRIRNRTYLALLLLFLASGVMAQTDNKIITDTLFFDSEISRVDIIINPDSLTEILASGNEESYHEFPAKFIFTNSLFCDTIDSVGFRLRGNTSRYSQKKSFKVSFNTFKSMKFFGVEKLNLNGEHNDPSVIRSKLSWDIFYLMDIPAPRAAYTELYINEEYKGLYINVEHIDEEFIKNRFGNNSGNLYKCLWPADLVYLGQNPDLYKLEQGDRKVYDLKTNKNIDDYSDLAHFIDILNNTPEEGFPGEIEKVFNVDGFIRYLVVEALVGHWDAYSVNKNNYYLYHNIVTGKFEFIPYDLDNTFGIDWFGIDWGLRNIYTWYSDNEPRPLTEKILDIQEYRDRYSFYMKRFMDEYFNNNTFFPIIDTIKSMIDDYAETDPYRPLDYGWSFDDYNRSYDEALGAHVTYGLKPYIAQRAFSANNQLIVNNIIPAFSNVKHFLSEGKDTLFVMAKISDELTVNTKLVLINTDALNDTIDFINNEDSNNHYTNSRVYTVAEKLNIESGKIEYFILATDESLQEARYPKEGNIAVYINQTSANLTINEFMASNTKTIADNYGEFNDWIEIYNKSTEEVFLGNKYLTDDLTKPDKWQMPSITMPAGGFLLIWADKDEEQGYNHAGFKLSKSGEEIGIFEANNNDFILISSVEFGAQQSDVSSGSITDGDGILSVLNTITPNYSNTDNSQATITINVNMSYQQKLGNFNPANDYMDIAGTFNDWAGSEPIYDSNDDLIYAYTLFNMPSGQHIEYKFRINADWGTSEFPNSGPNREYDVPAGLSILNHWYNDEEDPDFIVNNVIDDDFIVWPNPVTSMLFFKNTLKSDEIQVIDYTGKVMLKQYLSSQNSINLENLPGGIYVIVFFEKGQIKNMARIIKK